MQNLVTLQFYDFLKTKQMTVIGKKTPQKTKNTPTRKMNQGKLRMKYNLGQP